MPKSQRARHYIPLTYPGEWTQTSSFEFAPTTVHVLHERLRPSLEAITAHERSIYEIHDSINSETEHFFNFQRKFEVSDTPHPEYINMHTGLTLYLRTPIIFPKPRYLDETLITEDHFKTSITKCLCEEYSFESLMPVSTNASECDITYMLQILKEFLDSNSILASTVRDEIIVYEQKTVVELSPKIALAVYQEKFVMENAEIIVGSLDFRRALVLFPRENSNVAYEEFNNIFSTCNIEYKTSLLLHLPKQPFSISIGDGGSVEILEERVNSIAFLEPVRNAKVLLNWCRKPVALPVVVTIEKEELLLYARSIFDFFDVCTNIDFQKKSLRRKIVIERLPATLRFKEQIDAWIRSLLEPRGVAIEHISMKSHTAQNLDTKTKQDLITYFNNRIHSTIKEPLQVSLLTLIKQSEEKSAMPWKFAFEESEHVNSVEICFEHADFWQIIPPAFTNLGGDNYFKPNSKDRAPTEVLPQYCITLPMPIELLAVLHSSMIMLNQKCEKTNKAPMSWASITSASNVCGIEIVGWPKSEVENLFFKLQDFLGPSEFKPNKASEAWLFHGVGAAWVRGFLEQHKAAALGDVDATRRCIKVFGPSRNYIVNTLTFIARNPALVKICELQLTFDASRFRPSFFDLLFHINSQVDFRNMFLGSSSNKPDIVLNKEKKTIKFSGTVTQLQHLEAFIDKAENLAYDHAFPSVRLERSTSRPICAICTSAVENDFFRLEACAHAFCRGCINQQILTNQYTATNTALTCAECSVPFAADDIEFLLLGAGGGFGLDARLKFLDSQKYCSFVRSSITTVTSKPDCEYVVCRSAECDQLFRKVQIHESGEAQNALCPQCKLTICLQCGWEVHEGLSCREHMTNAVNDDTSLRTYAESIGTKNFASCPNPLCHVFIEKDQGCHHMFCTRCMTHFCWLCRQLLPDVRSTYAHLIAQHEVIGDEQELLRELELEGFV